MMTGEGQSYKPGILRIGGKPPEARKRQGGILPYRIQREHGSANT